MNSMTFCPVHDITVEHMSDDEKIAVRKMFYRSFPLLQRIFFSWTPCVLVAKRGGVLLGAVFLKLYPLKGERKGGFVSWIFTAPEARGTGVGQSLTDAAIDYFTSQGCCEISACVEGYNASSSKLFAERGFSVISPGQQLRSYGLRILPTWFHMFHLMDIGHFLWVRPGSGRRDNSAVQWWGTLAAYSLIVYLAVLRNGKPDDMIFAVVPLINLLFFGIRWLTMKITSGVLNLKVRFRAWETGLLVSLGIALIFGGLFPAAGNVYPVKERWRYRDLISKLGPVAFSGIIPTLLLAGAARCLLRFTVLPAAFDVWLKYASASGASLALFDVVFVFFPFASFNGRRIWDWNRPLWIIAVLPALIICFL